MYHQRSPLPSPSTSPISSFCDSKKFATQRWNLILNIFYHQMPLKCHWKYLWPYENSFTGKEAVDFLMWHLSKVFLGQSVQRANCARLLQKFLSQGLIFNVRNPKDLEFSEKNNIYRFHAAKIEFEICKTSSVTFKDDDDGGDEPQQRKQPQQQHVQLPPSSSSFSNAFVVRRNEDESNSSPSRTQFLRGSTFSTQSPGFVKSSSLPKRSFFSSFRNHKRSKLQDPIFNVPPPPSTPPPPASPPLRASMIKRRETNHQFSTPITRKYHRLSER